MKNLICSILLIQLILSPIYTPDAYAVTCDDKCAADSKSTLLDSYCKTHSATMKDIAIDSNLIMLDSSVIIACGTALSFGILANRPTPEAYGYLLKAIKVLKACVGLASAEAAFELAVTIAEMTNNIGEDPVSSDARAGAVMAQSLALATGAGAIGIAKLVAKIRARRAYHSLDNDSKIFTELTAPAVMTISGMYIALYTAILAVRSVDMKKTLQIRDDSCQTILNLQSQNHWEMNPIRFQLAQLFHWSSQFISLSFAGNSQNMSFSQFQKKLDCFKSSPPAQTLCNGLSRSQITSAKEFSDPAEEDDLDQLLDSVKENGEQNYNLLSNAEMNIQTYLDTLPITPPLPDDVMNDLKQIAQRMSSHPEILSSKSSPIVKNELLPQSERKPSSNLSSPIPSTPLTRVTSQKADKNTPIYQTNDSLFEIISKRIFKKLSN